VARPDFPKTLLEFQRQFATEQACADYLVASRWPDGFRCPRCDHQRAFLIAGRAVWQCANRSCRHQVSLRSGTVFERSTTPLTTWFWTAFLVAMDKRGLSALLLQRQFGVTYKTAWLMLHKLRRAMVSASRQTLSGEIEMDETWVGGPQPGVRGSRQLRGRNAALVIVAIERRGKGSGRVRMEVIADFRGKTMLDFARRNIAAGSTLYTDGLTGYRLLGRSGYTHVPETQGNIRKGAKHVVPRADRAMGNLKQWLLGTHHGVSREHLQAYLDEFVFRHNRRGSPMAAFQTLLGLGAQRDPAPLAVIRHASDLRKFPIAP
jgi:transposase-like protein